VQTLALEKEKIVNLTTLVCDKMYTNVSTQMHVPEAKFEYQNLALIYTKKN